MSSILAATELQNDQLGSRIQSGLPTLEQLWEQSIALRQQSIAVRAAAMEIRMMSRELRSTLEAGLVVEPARLG